MVDLKDQYLQFGHLMSLVNKYWVLKLSLSRIKYIN